MFLLFCGGFENALESKVLPPGVPWKHRKPSNLLTQENARTFTVVVVFKFWTCSALLSDSCCSIYFGNSQEFNYAIWVVTKKGNNNKLIMSHYIPYFILMVGEPSARFTCLCLSPLGLCPRSPTSYYGVNSLWEFDISSL